MTSGQWNVNTGTVTLNARKHDRSAAIVFMFKNTYMKKPKKETKQKTNRFECGCPLILRLFCPTAVKWLMGGSNEVRWP